MWIRTELVCVLKKILQFFLDSSTIQKKLEVYENLTKELIEAQQSLREELKEDPVSLTVASTYFQKVLIFCWG